MLSVMITTSNLKCYHAYTSTAGSASSSLPSGQALIIHSLAQNVARRPFPLRTMWTTSKQLEKALSNEVKCGKCSTSEVKVDDFCRQCNKLHAQNELSH